MVCRRRDHCGQRVGFSADGTVVAAHGMADRPSSRLSPPGIADEIRGQPIVAAVAADDRR